MTDSSETDNISDAFNMEDEEIYFSSYLGRPNTMQSFVEGPFSRSSRDHFDMLQQRRRDAEAARVSSRGSLPSAGSAMAFSPQAPARRDAEAARTNTRGSLPSASSAMAFNPQAPDFVPTTPSKRKASSSAKSGKSGPRNSRSSFQIQHDIQASRPELAHPLLIKREDIFREAGKTKNVSPQDSHDLSPDASTATAQYLAASPTFSNNSEPESEDDFPLSSVRVITNQSAHQSAQQYTQNFPPLRPAQSAQHSVFAPTSARYASQNALMQPSPSAVSRLGHTALERKLALPKQSVILIIRNREPSKSDASVPEETDRFRYLPLCSASYLGRSYAASSDFTILPSHRGRIDAAQSDRVREQTVWPAHLVPVEIFDLITQNLARDDVKNLRLVNHEFEAKVSRSLFHTSVVPFNTELYDMIDEEVKTGVKHFGGSVWYAGKGKAKAIDNDVAASEDDGKALHWQNAKADHEGKVYKGHGLKVFQGFGPHIKRFGMSFEVSELQLSHPPVKKELDDVESYHGAYTWPPAHYTRFSNLAGLESTADETTRMKDAFKNLKIVHELALSLDSGLGWLNGPDKSIYSRVFEKPSAVFGSAYNVPDHQTQAATSLWEALQQSQASFNHGQNPKEATLFFRQVTSTPAEIEGLKDTYYSDTRLWSSVKAARVAPVNYTWARPESTGFGALFTNASNDVNASSFQGSLRNPGELQKAQKEWLLETGWAQRAFLESYMLAVIDNPSIFGKVTTLNIAKLSSNFLSLMMREQFWEALPCLEDVKLHVSADWRSVAKDSAGFAEMNSQIPSEAVTLFHSILQQRISVIEGITKLNIGWVGGGEHAEGLFARNSNILPAPITLQRESTANSTQVSLKLPHVVHLTLTNCWMTPLKLQGLVESHANDKLKKLTLDSVSLTAHPRFPTHGHGNANAAQINAAQAAAIQGLQNGNMPPANAGGNAMNAHIGNHMWQQMQQAQQQLQHAQHAQQQLQQQMQQLANQAGQPAPNFFMLPNLHHGPAGIQNHANPTVTPAQVPPANWTVGHRAGSWPEVLDLISPGPNLSDYLPQPAPWEAQLPDRPATNLETIELKSVGYARTVNHSYFDQSALEAEYAMHHVLPSPWFRARQASLKPVMMETRDRHIGQIIPHVPDREMMALSFAWGLREGWEDTQKAEEAEYDGQVAGGTGRITGVIRKGMALVAPRLLPPGLSVPQSTAV